MWASIFLSSCKVSKKVCALLKVGLHLLLIGSHYFRVRFQLRVGDHKFRVRVVVRVKVRVRVRVMVD